MWHFYWTEWRIFISMRAINAFLFVHWLYLLWHFKYNSIALREFYVKCFLRKFYFQSINVKMMSWDQWLMILMGLGNRWFYKRDKNMNSYIHTSMEINVLWTYILINQISYDIQQFLEKKTPFSTFQLWQLLWLLHLPFFCSIHFFIYCLYSPT